MPDVTGQRLDVALSDIDRAGHDKDDIEVLGGGMFGVIDESNWQVCDQDPAAGTAIDAKPRLTVDRSCELEEAPEESDAAEETSVEVPGLKGLSVAEAKQALRDVGLRIGEITRQFSAQDAGTVLNQAVAVGTASEPGAIVPLVVAMPFPKVPSVVGKSASSATSLLKAAGFKVTTSKELRTSGTSGVVLSQSARGGERLKPGSEVHLVISNVVAPVVSSGGGGGSCTPGYSTCLAPAEDYDCAGGSGDGPKYTGYVEVTGSDPYGLDSDGDGIACENG
ncbi:MAG TPA: PASTA domain-containing protein [Nocardioidaceae bacterium]|nr:PASTA domain-containing protein [Nocardioidaceae bacterium]